MALDTLLPTLAGWTTMGEVQVGDELFDQDGKPCRVVATSAVMYNHDCYELEFDDGERIVADAGHRWLTFTAAERTASLRRSPDWQAKRRAARSSRAAGNKSPAFVAAIAARNASRAKARLLAPCGAIRTTAEIFDTLIVGRRRNHSIPVAMALQLPVASLPIPPFTLGVWLGDGKTVQGKVYVHGNDCETLRRIEQDGFTVRRVPSDPIGWTILGLQPSLRSIGVLGNKHIPDSYLRASVSDRLELLRGLMDTDGTCDADGGAEFTNTNARLAHGTLELVRSLGIKAHLSEGRAMLNGRDCGPKYRVKMTTAMRVFNLDRKANRQTAGNRRTQRHRYIVACRKVASVPVKCVAVDSPSRLYLAGLSMVPTHNSDLLIGLAGTKHIRAVIFRREFPRLRAIIDRSREIFTGKSESRLKDSFNEGLHVWRLSSDSVLEFASIQYEKDKENQRGRPRDFYGWDELTEFTESQFRFVNAWNRSTHPGQRCRIVATGNPPTSAEGEWVIRYWAPWLDGQHPNPAEPGELRWFARIENRDVEVESGKPIVRDGETIQPRSRTFIPAKLADNPALASTGYRAVLQAMPEPLRSQMLYGDFSVGVGDDPWQLIPTAWVRAAMARWTPERPAGVTLTAVGVDVARGGSDKTVLSRRCGPWFAPLEKHDGTATPDGPIVVSLVIKAVLENPKADVNVDIIGVGSSVYDGCRQHRLRAVPVNFSCADKRRDRAGVLSFCNLRSYAYWLLRDSLDPANGDNLALPNDPELLADLTTPRWKMTPSGVRIEPKEDIISRIGRSPDCGDAVVLARLEMVNPLVYEGDLLLWPTSEGLEASLRTDDRVIDVGGHTVVFDDDPGERWLER